MKAPELNTNLELSNLSPDALDSESENDDHVQEPVQPQQQQGTTPLIPGMEMADFECIDGFKLQLVSSQNSAINLGEQIYSIYLDWKTNKQDKPKDKKPTGYLG